MKPGHLPGIDMKGKAILTQRVMPNKNDRYLIITNMGTDDVAISQYNNSTDALHDFTLYYRQGSQPILTRICPVHATVDGAKYKLGE